MQVAGPCPHDVLDWGIVLHNLLKTETTAETKSQFFTPWLHLLPLANCSAMLKAFLFETDELNLEHSSVWLELQKLESKCVLAHFPCQLKKGRSSVKKA